METALEKGANSPARAAPRTIARQIRFDGVNRNSPATAPARLVPRIVGPHQMVGRPTMGSVPTSSAVCPGAFGAERRKRLLVTDFAWPNGRPSLLSGAIRRRSNTTDHVDRHDCVVPHDTDHAMVRARFIRSDVWDCYLASRRSVSDSRLCPRRRATTSACQVVTGDRSAV